MRKFFLFLLVTIPFLTNCNKDNNGNSNNISTYQNLIQNPSFESNGQPNGQSWYQYGSEIEDSTFFSNDTHPNGGNWSLKLWPGWMPGVGYAETYFTGQSGTNIFQLTGWMKSLNNWKGFIAIGILSQDPNFDPDTILQSKSIYDNPANWTQYTLIDTLTTQATDTIVIRLSAGSCQLCAGAVLFDIINLVKK